MTFCREAVTRVLERHVADKRVCHDLGALIAKGAPLSACAKIIDAAPSMSETARANALRVCRASLATALNVSWRDHLAMQARLQTWIDNSISKTINCSPDTTVDDVMNIYIEAWRLRLKGVAIYRTSSRAQEVLVSTNTGGGVEHVISVESVRLDSNPETVQPLAQPQTQVIPLNTRKRARPPILHGITSKYDTLFGSVFTTVNFDDHDDPLELFTIVGKSGTEVQAESEAIGRLISLILRMDSSITPTMRVEMIIHQLSNIGGSRDFRDIANRRTIRSIPDAVAIQLRDIMNSRGVSKREDEHESERGDRDICPACKGLTLVKIERCMRCINEGCAYSACS
jgi:ribonucleoside-diphosphate reductase alpha chain